MVSGKLNLVERNFKILYPPITPITPSLTPI